MAAKKPKSHPAFIKVYFTGYDEPLAKQIETLAKDHGLSASIVGAKAIRIGFPVVKKQLDGLFADVNPELNKESNP